MEDPRQPEGDKQENPKPRFNSYWVYALIGLALIIFNLISFSSISNDPIRWDRFATMVKDSDVERLEVVNEQYAYIYLKKERLSDEKYSDASISKFGSPKPHFYFNIGPAEVFAKRLDELNTGLSPDQRVEPQYIEKQNWQL